MTLFKKKKRQYMERNIKILFVKIQKKKLADYLQKQTLFLSWMLISKQQWRKGKSAMNNTLLASAGHNTLSLQAVVLFKSKVTKSTAGRAQLINMLFFSMYKIFQEAQKCRTWVVL